MQDGNRKRGNGHETDSGATTLGNRPLAKAGRKRKPGARYPSGEHLKQNPMETAIEARVRIYGVSPERAKRQETGTAIGRAYDNRDENNVRLLSRHQLDALQEWDKALHDMKTATDAKRMRSGSDFSGAGGFDGNDGTDEAYVRFCARAKERYRLLRKAILDSGPLGHMAVQTWVECDNYDLRCLGDLRLAANAISRTLRTPPK
jgi:hypothetical protein